MILFPAIDLVGGRVVRLQRGDRSKMDVYSDDPASVARDFAAAAEFGELLVADVAAKDGVVKVNGWREGEKVSLSELVGRLSGLGYRHLVFTDINRDGMQTGVDVDAYRSLAALCGFPVVASGGISTLDDVRALAAAGPDVIEGAITGRALYEGSFSLAEALLAASGGN